MGSLSIDHYIGQPLDLVKKELEAQGINVEVVKNSKPKIITDTELVVCAKVLEEKQVLLIVGDFLINLEVKDGLV